jgi:uncharacterized protein (TIGR03067 family)
LSDYNKSTKGEDIIKAIEGKWKQIYSEIEGEAMPSEQFSTIETEFKEREFFVRKDGQVIHQGKFSVNISVTPNECFFFYTKSVHDLLLGAPRPGIFQLTGNTLKFNFGPVGQRTPQDFNTFPTSNAVSSIYTRGGGPFPVRPNFTLANISW